MEVIKRTGIWKNTLGADSSGTSQASELLRKAFIDFRKRVKVEVIMPTKKPRGRALTRAQKAAHRRPLCAYRARQ